MTDREQRLMNAIATMSAISVRQSIASRLGKSFSDNRNLYDALGYKTNPTFNDYAAKYQRMDIARTIVDLPVRECWRNVPDLTESKDKDTPFETEWLNLVKSHRIFHYLSRADRLGSLGTYSVLYLGFDDSADPKDEVTKARNLLYMMPYSMANTSISEYETDAKSPRYGKPAIYSLNVKSISSASSSAQGATVNVHHSRIIHIAEDCLEDDVEGIPRLRAVLNRLEDIEKLSGGSAEMFWLGAFPGFGIKLDPGHTIGTQGLDDLEDEIEKYIHTPQRYMRLRGMSIENLGTQIADPKGHMDVQLDLISAATRIPKRILLGSERGELSSNQDEKNWAKVIQARQSEHCEPVLLRPFVDKLITVGILPKPANEEYTAEWPDLLAPGDKDKADIGEVRSKALKNYVDAIGADDVLPPTMFYKKVLGLTDDEIQEIEDLQATMLAEEAADGDVEPEEEPEEEEDESGGDGDAQG
jgi:hypothetical protein